MQMTKSTAKVRVSVAKVKWAVAPTIDMDEGGEVRPSSA